MFEFLRRKKIDFPEYKNLSYEQKNAIALDFYVNNLVIGAPGTGKTIVALYRLHKLYESGIKNNRMLVFNRALMDYIKNVQKEMGWENDFKVYTVNDWLFYELYCGSKKIHHEDGIKKDTVPSIKENEFLIDWEKVKEDFEDDKNIFDHIVIDEGQDFPKVFFEIIVNIAKNVTIYADPNQSLQKDRTSISEMLDVIGKDMNYTLTLNYRNSRAIASFTRNYCYDRSIFAESYREKENLNILNIPKDDADCFEKIYQIVKNYDKSTEIGIIVPNVSGAKTEEEKRKLTFGIYDYLNSKLNDRNVELYYNKETLKEEIKSLFEDKKNIDFNNKSIKIFNYMTVRGLDFDVVIVLDNISFNAYNGINDDEMISNLNKIYVASTRAKEDLYIIPLDETSKDFVDESNCIENNIDFPVLREENKVNYYLKAKELYENGDKIKALYYLHYILSVIGFDDDIELYNNAVVLFSEICEEFNKNDFAISMIINFEHKYKEYYNEELKSLYNKLLKNSFKNRNKPKNDIEDKDENQKIDIVSKIAYLLGLDKDKYFEVGYEENIFEQLERNKQAKIIRTLCNLRNICINNFLNIKNIMNVEPKPPIYNISEFFSESLFTFLKSNNIDFSMKEYRVLEEFEMKLNSLIQERIGNITNLFPTFVKYEYIRDMFIMPNGSKYTCLQTEAEKYRVNKAFYPFNLYLNWKPEDCGNLLKDDHHFCNNLYFWHKERFDENGKTIMIDSKKKTAFDKFVENHKKLLLAVDCENSDPYRLCAAINTLDQNYIENIYKMLLIDDKNASNTWPNLDKMTQIPIEYKSTNRILENKSLVDGTLIANVVKEVYSNNVDAVIIGSSDSDFFAIIENCEGKDFFVLCEHNFVSKEYINKLESKNIGYCFIDDFDSTEADQIREDDFKNNIIKTLNECLTDVKAKDLTSNTLKLMRVDKNEQEKNDLLEKYVKNLKIYVDDDDSIKVRWEKQ